MIRHRQRPVDRHVVSAVAAVLFCATVSRDALAAPFGIGDVITYTQASWGDPAQAGGAAITAHYDSVYAPALGMVEIGLPGAAGFSITFTSAGAVFFYLPSSGLPAPLSADLVDPGSSASGVFGGDVLGLRLAIDFSDAGYTLGSLGVPFGDLTLHGFAGPLAGLNGLSVRAFSDIANIALSGGVTPYSITDLNFLTFDLNGAFADGIPSPFAQDHLRIAAASPVPEPATLSLLGIGAAAVTARRVRCQRASRLTPRSMVSNEHA